MSPVGMGARLPPRASTARPDPDGLDAPLPFMGGMGGPRFFGRSSSSFGHPPHQPSLGSGFSTSSMAENYRQLNFPGPIPAVIPQQVVFGQGHRPPPPPPYGGFLLLLLLRWDIIMRLHRWRLPLLLLIRRIVLCPMKISLPRRI